MASSILTGDRRWATTRKSGMTVLGKVPKPINLPSQRLENHGLDPNVEIVPKGTLTWGSRPSSTTPNAWGTPNISSPSIDGSSGSPSHASGRPSSGGSGTRPSTAGSDKSLEPLSNAWGSNSRPSSASGILTSSQISAAATRPRSAETRPGSSQLSRFADNSTDSTGACAWGPPGSAERLAGVSSKTSGFTLSSGDFPTLSSDKSSDTNSQRGHSSQGRPLSSQGRPLSSQGRPLSSQGRPLSSQGRSVSASGTNSAEREILEPQLPGSRHVDSLERGNVDTWKADNLPHAAAHGAPPNMENWQRDPRQLQRYPNMNMPPPQYDSWHNPPFHPAEGAWYRGPAAAGPYRPPGPPGTYPIDCVPPRSFPNPQPFPRSYPNCEPYRPHMPPEHYMRPSNSEGPIRPGSYPGPVPYEGYYGPPRPNIYNPGDRDAPIMGGMPRPLVHNQYPTQHPNFDSGNFHARPGGYGTVVSKDQMKPDYVHEAQGPYRVLLKQHGSPEDRGERANEEYFNASGSAHPQREKHPEGLTQEGKVETKSQKQVAPAGEAVSSEPSSHVDGPSSDTVVSKSVGATSIIDEGLIRRPEAADVQSCGQQQYPIIRKNPSLMEKVETLNSKARNADGRNEDRPFSSKEKTKSFKDVPARDNPTTKAVSSIATSTGHAPDFNKEAAVPKESSALKEVQTEGPTTDGKVLSGPSNFVGFGENAHLGQKNVHGAKGGERHPKVKSIRHDNDDRAKRNPGSEPLINKVQSEDSLGAPSEKQEFHHAAGVGDGSQTSSSLDPTDYKAQRAKIKEIAQQRAKQLQEEEERRVKEQRAKALAKLEELNRRTLAENFNSNSSTTPQSNDEVQNGQQPEPVEVPKAISTEDSGGTSACQSDAVVKQDDDETPKAGIAADLTSSACAEISNSNAQTLCTLQIGTIILGQQDNIARVTVGASSDAQNYTASKQKQQVGYRRKQSPPLDNSSTEKHPQDTSEVAAVHASVSLPNTEDQSVQHRKKHSRNVRNNKNNKLDDGPKSSTAPAQSDSEENSKKDRSEIEKAKPVVVESVLASCEGWNDTTATQSSGEEPSSQVSSETTEETRTKAGGSSWKSHHHRKSSRNQQPNKPISKYHGTEAVVWAPVKPLAKNETQEANQNTAIEATALSAKSGNDPPAAIKSKRAEIERYVPKPVAKELSQQANSQQASGELVKTVSPKLDGTSTGKAVAVDSKNGESTKHNKKHGRISASWRQRGSVEPPSVDVPKVTEQQQLVIDDSFQKTPVPEFSDGWVDNNNYVPPSESVTSAVVAKSSGTSRQRRDPYRAQRGRGNNYPAADNLDSQQRISDKSEHQIEPESRNIAKTESQKAHWQPKSQVLYSHGRQENRGTGGPRVASQGTVNLPTVNEDNNAPSKVAPDVSKEQAALEYQHEQAAPFGLNPRRQQHNGRFQRGNDPSYRARDAGPEAGKQDFHPSGGDKRRNNSKNNNNPHVEYQRTESYVQPHQNPSSSEGSRYRERGNQYRRGGGGHLNARGGDSFNSSE